MLVFVPIFVSSTSQVICDDNESYFLCLQAELMWGSMDEEVKTTYGKSYFDQKVEQAGGQVYIQIHKYLHKYGKSYFDQKVKTGKRTNTQIKNIQKGKNSYTLYHNCATMKLNLILQVAIMKGYMTGGITDISPVINSYTDALLDVFPQVRLDVDADVGDKKAEVFKE